MIEILENLKNLKNQALIKYAQKAVTFASGKYGTFEELDETFAHFHKDNEDLKLAREDLEREIHRNNIPLETIDLVSNWTEKDFAIINKVDEKVSRLFNSFNEELIEKETSWPKEAKKWMKKNSLEKKKRIWKTPKEKIMCLFL